MLSTRDRTVKLGAVILHLPQDLFTIISCQMQRGGEGGGGGGEEVCLGWNFILYWAAAAADRKNMLTRYGHQTVLTERLKKRLTCWYSPRGSEQETSDLGRPGADLWSPAESAGSVDWAGPEGTGWSASYPEKTHVLLFSLIECYSDDTQPQEVQRTQHPLDSLKNDKWLDHFVLQFYVSM